jgi:adenine-specific DNA-methyltransferase
MAQIRNKNKLGQYFTPNEICNFMVGLSDLGNSVSALEPSSGSGAFLDALSRFGYQDVVGIEIDSELAEHDKFPVENCSFISWKSDKKFDLVIGNPPYIRWKDLDEPQKQEIKDHHFFGGLVNSLSDYLLPFIALSIELLREEGELIFITPAFWLQTKHSKGIRDFISSHGQITDLVDFGETPIFKGVSTSLIIFKFVKTQKKLNTTLHRYVGSKVGLHVLDLGDSAQFRSESITNFRIKDKFVPAFEEEIEIPLLLERNCAVNRLVNLEGEYEELGRYVRIANGMVTGLDQAFKLSSDDVRKIPESEFGGISKVVKGKNLSRLYSGDWTSYIDIDPKLSWDEVSKTYPTLIAHLVPFRDELEERYNYGDGSKWWHWSFYRSSDFLRSEAKKGFVPGKERLTHKAQVRFSLCTPNAVATQDVAAFAPKPETRESIQYIVAYLNRLAISKWVRAFGLMKGGVAEFSEKPLSEIPFRAIDWSNEIEVQAHQEIKSIMENLESGFITSEEADARLYGPFSALLPSELCA